MRVDFEVHTTVGIARNIMRAKRTGGLAGADGLKKIFSYFTDPSPPA
jgi:hypothetical protein